MKNKSLPIRIAIFVVAVAIAYYVILPPIHPQAIQFWTFLAGVIILGAFLFVGGLRRKERVIRTAGIERTVQVWVPNKKFLAILVLVGAGALALVVIGFIGSSQVLHAGAYSKLIDKQSSNFSEEVDEIPWNRIPTVDRDTAIRLGNRKMGEVVELVSQFTVSDEYTQINYKGDPMRVSPLQYASLIKWFTNQSEGIPYYMRVNMIDGHTDLIKSEKPLRYTKSERLNRNITRHLRFQYPLKLFYTSNFEIDEKGTPYWITPVYRMRVGLFGGPDVKEVILTNASTGESKLYAIKDAPKWIDYVYNANLIIQQINWNGKYQRGFINSIIGQKGVLAATEGYNYLALNDDVYLYTGITSVSADESNIGFVLVNMRTKECNFYSVPSAEEFSAMGSAEGAVQEKKYKATFPLLINVQNRPTYFLSLKDEAGLIKMYAFIDAENYQHVVTGSTVAEAYKAFSVQQTALGDGEGDANTSKTTTDVSGTIADIQPIVIDGNTVFYFMLTGDETVYIAPATISERLPFMKAGSSIEMTVESSKNGTARVQLINPEGETALPMGDETSADSELDGEAEVNSDDEAEGDDDVVVVGNDDDDAGAKDKNEKKNKKDRDEDAAD